MRRFNKARLSADAQPPPLARWTRGGFLQPPATGQGFDKYPTELSLIFFV